MLKVNGVPVDSSGTILDACRRAGADVPAFCSDDRLPSGGHCRACLVEAGGRLTAACCTPARDDLDILTDSERLRAYRRDLGELMLAEATPHGDVGQTLSQWGCAGTRYDRAPEEAAKESRHPYLRIDLSACIRCQKCVRACSDIQGQFVYAMSGRGASTRLGWGGGTLQDAGCVSCGACVAECPSGAITDIDRQRLPQHPLRTVRTTCSYCGVGCQLAVRADDTRVFAIDGAESPVNRRHLCVKGRYAHGFLRHPDRLTTPLIRRGDHFEPATWEEALALIARRFGEHRGHVAGLSSSRCTNEENYLVQKWIRTCFDSNDVDCCARVCHGPTAAGMRRVLGTGAATNSLKDIEAASLILCVGSNTTEAHPVTGARIKQAVLGGCQLVVIDPRRTELAAMADVHLAVRPGQNVPLLNSLAAVIVDELLFDEQFVATRTQGFQTFCAFIVDFLPEKTEAVTGVPAGLVRKAARLYASAPRPMQVHGLGVTEHYQGSESVMLLVNLALLVGAFGRAGVGVNPLRGQNNVQGAADMGCQPDLLTGYADPADPAVRERFEHIWQRPLPSRSGRTIPKMYEAIHKGDLRAMYILGEDVVQTDPDAKNVVAALKKLDFLVVQELFLSETAKLAHVVLPGASFLEKDGTFTNGERRVQRVRRVVDPPGQARADWQILCALLSASGNPQPFSGPADVLAEVARLSPLHAGISYARLEGDGLQWPVPGDTHPGTDILHRAAFPIGKAVLSCIEPVPSPALRDAEFPLLLVTGRALAHYNNGSMTRRTDNVQLRPDDPLEVHPLDAAALHIEDGAKVRVRSRWGEALTTAQITDRVLPGTLFLTFHFPETGTNQVTSNVTDRIADCPEYKVTPVALTRREVP